MGYVENQMISRWAWLVAIFAILGFLILANTNVPVTLAFFLVLAIIGAIVFFSLFDFGGNPLQQVEQRVTQAVGNAVEQVQEAVESLPPAPVVQVKEQADDFDLKPYYHRKTERGHKRRRHHKDHRKSCDDSSSSDSCDSSSSDSSDSLHC